MVYCRHSRDEQTRKHTSRCKRLTIKRVCQILKLDHFFSSNALSCRAVLYAIKERRFLGK
jgi:hypothetical protein